MKELILAATFLTSVGAFAQLTTACPNLSGTYKSTKATEDGKPVQDFVNEVLTVKQTGCTEVQIATVEDGDSNSGNSGTIDILTNGKPVGGAKLMDDSGPRVFISFTFVGNKLVGQFYTPKNPNDTSANPELTKMDGMTMSYWLESDGNTQTLVNEVRASDPAHLHQGVDAILYLSKQ